MKCPDGMVAVYALTDDNGEVRYVGQTKHPAERLSCHVGMYGASVPMRAWLESLARAPRSWQEASMPQAVESLRRPPQRSGAADAAGARRSVGMQRIRRPPAQSGGPGS
jgi:hypothetical protein